MKQVPYSGRKYVRPNCIFLLWLVSGNLCTPDVDYYTNNTVFKETEDSVCAVGDRLQIIKLA
jgi:hypothetical protein